MKLRSFAGACLLAAFTAASLAGTTGTAHSASCKSIRGEFERKVRPAMLRVAKKNFRRGNWFLVTLKKKHGDGDPTLSDINATYKEMVDGCSDASCRSYAKEIAAASRRVFDINRRWVRQGCPGRLDK